MHKATSPKHVQPSSPEADEEVLLCSYLFILFLCKPLTIFTARPRDVTRNETAATKAEPKGLSLQGKKAKQVDYRKTYTATWTQTDAKCRSILIRAHPVAIIATTTTRAIIIMANASASTKLLRPLVRVPLVKLSWPTTSPLGKKLR